MNYTDPKTGVRVSTHITQPVEYEAWINGKKVETSSDSMTNEKEWWEEGGMSNGPMEETFGWSQVEKIVAEAMRRGEVKAWEEASTMLKDVKQRFRCAACDGASNLSHTLTCSAFAEIDAKLTSLKTP